MILVTGAAGKTGRAVLRALKARGERLRALVRRAEQAAIVEAAGAGEAVVGDMRSQPALEEALRGVRAVCHIPPNVSPDEVPIGASLIAAARAAGVERIVYHSVLHPQTETMPHHWQKLRVEEALLASGLPYTILQPAVYMQNVLAHWAAICREGIYPVPYAAATRLSLVDLEDVAQAAACVLTESGHLGATYELVGTEALSQDEIATALGEGLSRAVRVEVVPLDAWEQGARRAGLGEYAVYTLLKMFRYYERHGFIGGTRVLGWLLGRPPTSFEAFVRRAASERPCEDHERPD
jgi:NAD(P)H dehydrogenase (quinone)